MAVSRRSVLETICVATLNGNPAPCTPSCWRRRLSSRLRAARTHNPAANGRPLAASYGPFDTVVSPPFTEIVGNTTINVPVGDGIDAGPDAAPGGHLSIDTELGPSPGPISIISGGTGVASIFPSSPANITINSGPRGDVTITSGGAALGISGDVSLTASNANGGALIFQSTGAEAVVAQFGATMNITGATIVSNGFAGSLSEATSPILAQPVR